MLPLPILVPVLALAAALPAQAPAPPEVPPPDVPPKVLPPNVLLIVADDLGYGDLGCYGQRDIATPNLDRLAARGLRFVQHYAGSTVCAPSRACLLTGLHTGHGHVRGNGDVALRAADTTCAHLLQKAGYRTGMVGKSSTACRTADPAQPATCGFEHFYGLLDHGAAHHYFPPRIVSGGGLLALAGNERHEGAHYSHDLFLEDALAFLERHREGPFFLLYSAQLPHASLYAPDRWREPYVGRFEEEPVTDQRHYRNEPMPKATFAGMVSRLDWEVGELVGRLEALGIAGDTLVLFTSDNGAMDEGGHRRASFRSSGPLRGGKRDLYEGGIRVPLIACWPGRVAAGATTEHVSAFWDFVPTVCALAGVEPPAGIDGIAYAPTLLGVGDQEQHAHLYWEFHEQGGKRAVRFGDWKAVQLGVAAAPDGPVEIYDLAADPAERRDLAGGRPALVARARELFRSSAARCAIERFNFPDR